MPQAVERNRVATEKERAEANAAREKELADKMEGADNEQDEPEHVAGGSDEESCEEPIKLPPILLIYDGHGSHTTLDWVTQTHSCTREQHHPILSPPTHYSPAPAS